MTDTMNPPDVSSLPTSPAPNIPAPSPQPPSQLSQPTQPTPQNTQPPVPSTNMPAPQVQPQAKPHPLARAFDAILKSATGGDAYYTDPDTGERKVAPQSRGTLGRTLIAATLAGMLAPDSYRDTPFGPVRDFTGTAGNAMKASQETLQAARNKPQKYSDEQQTAKLRVIETNAKTLALHTAQWQLKQSQFAHNKPTIDATNDALQQYENNRDPKDANQPSAWLDGARGLSAQDVLSKGYKLSDSLVYQDGESPDGEPTYAIINPAMRNVTLTKAQTALLEQVNSQYRNIHAVVGGKVTVPMSTFISGMQDYAMLNSAVTKDKDGKAGGWLNDLNTQINGDKAKPINQADFFAAVRNNPQALKTMWTLTHANAAGNIPDQRADNLLSTLATNAGGDQILKLLGMTATEAQDKANDISRERTAKDVIAKYGYSDKSPTAPEQIDEMNARIAQAPADVQEVMAPWQQDQHPTKAQFRAEEQAFQRAMQQSTRNRLMTGDPATIQTSVSNVIMGDTTDIKDMMSARNNVRLAYSNALQSEAARLGLDRSRYTLSAQEARNQDVQDYSSDDKNKVGGQIVGFDKMLGHFNEAYEANKNWTRSRSPLINRPIKWLDKNAMDDQDYQRFQSSILAPLKEYINLLNQGRAEQQEDAKELSKVINDNMSPTQVMTSLTTLAQTADVQMAALGTHYLQTVGTTYPVVSATGASILETILGKGKSRAAKLAQPIPRGWQQVNGQLQATPLTDPRLVNQIMEDAGGDYHKATQIARENGWAVPDPKK